MIIKTKSGGWQVMSADGKKPLSDPDLSRAEAEKREKEIGERSPLKVWARERGKLVRG